MIAHIVRFAVANRLLVLLASAGLLAWGVWEAPRMPVDVFPDLTAPTVTVVAEAHGMAPEEVERLITFPIETAMNGATGVRRVRSSTAIGSAVVWIDFDWGIDIYRARQVVSEKLQLVRDALPRDVPPPLLAPVTSIMGEILFIALRSDAHDPMTLKTVADWTLRQRLLAVPGVAQVIPIGGDTRQYQVEVDPLHLAARRLTLAEVVEAVRGANDNSSAGFVADGGQEYLIRGVGRVRSATDIGSTVIAVREGVPVLVRDVAVVTVGPALKRGTGAHDGQPAVVLGIQKQPEANTLALTAELDRVFAEIGASLPSGMRIESNVFRQADFIDVAIANVGEALRDGAILVVVIVFVFLANLRATLIALMAIPLSLVVAVLVLNLGVASINTMTLGGMAIALGALVDDAIIVVENVVRRLRLNQAAPHPRPAREVVAAATQEIQGSIVFATLIIMLVFLPLFFLAGVEGRLLEPLGLAYVVSLAASLLAAVTVTPAAAAWLLPAGRAGGLGDEPWLTRTTKRLYAHVLEATLRHGVVLAFVAFVAFAGAVVVLSQVGRSFLPDFNEGSLTISAVTLPGTSLEQSDALAGLAERVILGQAGVVATIRRTGRAELDEHAQGVNASEIDVALDLRIRDKAAVVDGIRAALGAVPGMNITIGQPISHRIDHMLSGTRANIAVKIYGDDLAELRRIAEAVRAQMEGVRGVVDLSLEQQGVVPMLDLVLRRDVIARHGLRPRDVTETIEAAFAGADAGRVLEGNAAFDVVVRYPPQARADRDALARTRILAPDGAELPLSALADIRRNRSPNMISRENVRRKMVVMANVSGRDLLGVVGDIRARVASGVVLPHGYYVEYGGQFESAQAATRRLALLSAAVVIGVFVLLALAFGSMGDAVLVMVNLPLALIGGVAGVLAAGEVMSVASIIGFITLFGIATRNGVMLVAHIRHLVESGEESDLRAAVRRGTLERLNPILMTALATALALVPLALHAGEPGSEIQAPMAIVILYGLLSSTVLNMLVLPALYLRFGAAGRRTPGVHAPADDRPPLESSPGV